MMRRPLQSGSLARARPGFTLIEVVLSVAMSSVLLIAMGALVVVASKAAPDRSRPGADVSAAAAGLELMASDLGQALTFTEASAGTVEFTVPDRDGDGSNESIRYEWSGSAGDSVMRMYNGLTKEAVVRSVASFSLKFRVASENLSKASTRDLVAAARVSEVIGGLILSNSLDSGKPLAQVVLPSLSADTASWTVTRVRIMMSRQNTVGTVRVEVRTVDVTGMPTSTVIASTTVAASAVATSMGYLDVAISGAPALAPGQEVAIVLTCDSGCPAVRVGSSTLAVAPNQSMWSYSSGGWSKSSLSVMPVEVYATTQRTVATTVSSKRMSDVDVAVRVGRAPELRASVKLVNAPEVP